MAETAAQPGDNADTRATAPETSDTGAKDTAATDTAAPDTEPADDLVTTQHSITIEDRELSYTATTGRIVLREEGHTDDKFDGAKARAEVFVTAYTADTGEPAGRDVRFQRRSRLVQRVAASRFAGAPPGAIGRRRCAAATAV
jgi:carboxypeptidase C (cathepsin A)